MSLSRASCTLCAASALAARRTRAVDLSRSFAVATTSQNLQQPSEAGPSSSARKAAPPRSSTSGAEGRKGPYNRHGRRSAKAQTPTLSDMLWMVKQSRRAEPTPPSTKRKEESLRKTTFAPPKTQFARPERPLSLSGRPYTPIRIRLESQRSTGRRSVRPKPRSTRSKLPLKPKLRLRDSRPRMPPAPSPLDHLKELLKLSDKVEVQMLIRDVFLASQLIKSRIRELHHYGKGRRLLYRSQYRWMMEWVQRLAGADGSNGLEDVVKLLNASLRSNPAFVEPPVADSTTAESEPSAGASPLRIAMPAGPIHVPQAAGSALMQSKAVHDSAGIEPRKTGATSTEPTILAKSVALPDPQAIRPGTRSSKSPFGRSIPATPARESCGAFSVSADTVSIKSVAPIKRAEVATLAHGLDRVLSHPGIHWLQDPYTQGYNFPQVLQDVMPITDFDFESLPLFIRPSQDPDLRQLLRDSGRKFAGSTSR